MNKPRENCDQAVTIRGSRMAPFGRKTVLAALAVTVLAGGLLAARPHASSDGDTAARRDFERAALTATAPRPGALSRPTDVDPFDWDALIVPTSAWRTDFTRHTVPLLGFRRGGPGRDGIPAIDEPRYETVAAAGEWIAPDDPILVLQLEDEVRGYPLLILIWHEIVNDTLGSLPVVVTYCPLCNTAIAFSRVVDGIALDFGVTGVLRHSDLVMYDRRTETWWQQFGGEAVVGELAGYELAALSTTVLPWREFVRRFPKADVLSRDTGFERPYGARPYIDYDQPGTPTRLGTANQSDGRLPLKERVVFVELEGEAVAVSFSALELAGTIRADVGGALLEFEWIPDVLSPFGASEQPAGRAVGSALVRRVDSDEPIVFDTPFWFVLAAFKPEVRVIDG